MSEPRRWRCPYCDGLNDWQNETCEICGDGRRDDAVAGKPEVPKTYTPQPRPAEPPKPEPEPAPEPPRPTPVVAPAASAAPAATAKGGAATAWFWILALGFIALSASDGKLAWWMMCVPLKLANTALCPRSPASYGLLAAAFLGLMPLAALWLRAKGAKALAVILALAGCACAGLALGSMYLRRALYALCWLPYLAATVMAVVYAVNGKGGRAYANLCLALAIVGCVATAGLTMFQEPGYGNYSVFSAYTQPLRSVGMMWWQRPDWAAIIFSTDRFSTGGAIPASAWVPFSRALLLAMSFGFRLPLWGRCRAKRGG